jgi:hypothetical protein
MKKASTQVDPQPKKRTSTTAAQIPDTPGTGGGYWHLTPTTTCKLPRTSARSHRQTIPQVPPIAAPDECDTDYASEVRTIPIEWKLVVLFWDFSFLCPE